jgi:hypothetical protein
MPSTWTDLSVKVVESLEEAAAHRRMRVQSPDRIVSGTGPTSRDS